MADRRRAAACLLCGAGEARHLVTKRGFEVVRCTACGLAFVWPQPTPEELEAFYSSGAYHAEVDEAERRRYFARRLGQIEAAAPRRGRILDVGCSRGIFLEVARDEGWDAVGVELNRHSVELARERGLDVRHGGLASQGFPDGSFDVVTLFDLIEHTAEPKAALAACHRVLRPDGLLVVTTPDIGGLVPRVTYGLFARTLGAWDHPTPPGHLVQFSRRTLQQMLAQSDFKVVAHRSEHIPMSYSAGKLENAVMDVLAGRHKTKPASKPGSGGDPSAGAAPTSGGGSALRRLPRYAARLAAWLVIGTAGLVARVIGSGDSMLVLAQRKG